jgi:putative ABC transport system permease protein
MTGLIHDLRYATRLLRRDWRFSITLVVTLATGIAATATVFNVLNNTLLRPLPIADEHRVFRLLDYTLGPDGQPIRRSTRVHNFLAIRDGARSFDTIVALRAMNFALDGGRDPVQVYISLVTPRAFELLNVRPRLGRLFTPEEEQAGVDAGVVILSHSLWQEHFGGRMNVVGESFRLDGRPHTVVGVLGPGFRFPYEVQAWIPERLTVATEASVATIARLAAGVTREQAQQELDLIAAGVEDERPDTNRGMRYAMQPLREQLIGDQAQVTWSLFATAALLLALSCANVANLLLARGTRRRREMAVQSAIGASRTRQAQQLIVESLVYCAIGTAFGVALAVTFGDVVMSLVPLPIRTQLGLGDVAFDWRVVLFATAATAITAVLAGVTPARRLVNTNPIEALRQQTRGTTGPRTLMHVLVVGEVALAAVLLLTAALMADNLTRLTRTELGLQAEDLSSIEITLPERQYTSAEQRIGIVRAMIDASRSVAGVTAAGIVTVNPLDRGSFGAPIESEDRPLAPREAGLIVNNRLVTYGWFEAAGVRVLRGRAFDETDGANAPPVVIVSQRMAARLWPGVDPLNKRIRVARPNTPWLTVVGVVADVRDFGDWRETWYLPYPQHAASFGATTLHLMLRSPLPPDVLGNGVRSAMRKLAPQLPIPIPTPMTDMWDAGLEQERLAASASALFGISGLLLAVIGTYGVLAYVVSARAREFGIRVALGAARRALLWEVLSRGVLLAGTGLVVGTLAGLAVNRSLRAVAGESAGTPVFETAVLLAILAASAIAASLIPALRATRVDPADVMRLE